MRYILFIVALSIATTTLPGRAAQTTSTADIVAAADAFLSSLTTEQRKQTQFAFDDATQRARWSNFPTGFVPRGGISLKQMSPTQRAAALHLLATVLSPMGLEKVDRIRQADDDFKVNGSKRGPPGGRGGSPPGPLGPPPGGPQPGFSPGGARPPFSSDDLFGSDLYYLSVLGAPSVTQPWMLQFGGHHLALNITVVGARNILTPTLTGAQPAVFDLNGKVVRPLGRESDKALALVQSLDASQRARAVLGYVVPDLILGPGQDGRTIAPEGLKASDMTAGQRAMLLDVIDEWAGIVNDSAAAERRARLENDLDETWFAWSGATAGKAGENITAYYRIQGPRLVIEYAPQHDEPGNHVHTIYRDPTDDYGRASAKR